MSRELGESDNREDVLSTWTFFHSSLVNSNIVSWSLFLEPDANILIALIQFSLLTRVLAENLGVKFRRRTYLKAFRVLLFL